MYNIHLLPASFGDSILIEYGFKSDPTYILIDGGPYYNFDELIQGLKRVAPDLKELELLVVSHIDIDHIEGIVTLLNQPTLPFPIKEIWFNGYKELEQVPDDLMGPLQGEYISTLIKKKNIPHNKTFFKNGPVMVSDYNNPPEFTLPGGMKITVLSPDKKALQNLKPKWEKAIEELDPDLDIEERLKEDFRYDDLLGNEPIEDLQESVQKGDRSPANQSSIAFIAEFDGKRCLFSADATTDILLKSINPMINDPEGRLNLDAWKLAHHGSKRSTLDTLMQKINCNNMLVSTNGTRGYQHPDDECIAKIIKFNGPGVNFYFNYLTEFNKRWQSSALQTKYKFNAIYPQNTPGISIHLIP